MSTEMKVEKIFKQTLRSEIKIVLTGRSTVGSKEVFVDVDFLIKGEQDHLFKPTIGISHPKYWKVKHMNTDEAKYMELIYSGISRKQLREALREFEYKYGSEHKMELSHLMASWLKGRNGIRNRATVNMMRASA